MVTGGDNIELLPAPQPVTSAALIVVSSTPISAPLPNPYLLALTLQLPNTPWLHPIDPHCAPKLLVLGQPASRLWKEGSVKFQWLPCLRS